MGAGCIQSLFHVNLWGGRMTDSSERISSREPEEERKRAPMGSFDSTVLRLWWSRRDHNSTKCLKTDETPVEMDRFHVFKGILNTNTQNISQQNERWLSNVGLR